MIAIITALVITNIILMLANRMDSKRA